jgi:hypothetical protein
MGIWPRLAFPKFDGPVVLPAARLSEPAQVKTTLRSNFYSLAGDQEWIWFRYVLIRRVVDLLAGSEEVAVLLDGA